MTSLGPKQEKRYDEESNLIHPSANTALQEEFKERTNNNESEARVLEKGTSSSRGNGGFLFWTVMNISSTVGIIFTNKAIMSDASFHNRQISLASYHFFITGATLWIVSRPVCGIFTPKDISILQVIPIAAAMCIQVVLQNLSLAYSSVMFHQLARLLLTPTVALMNYMLYCMKIPRAAVVPLILLCSGVGIVTYYDSLSSKDNGNATSTLGVMFALMGVCASSIYTVWIGYYHKRFELSSMQLLLNQAPVGACLLLCAIPWTDGSPAVSTGSSSMWSLIILSGFFACIVNLSQFYIVDAAGAVSGTVIGQAKTCIIVGMGWWLNNHVVPRQSMLGVALALIGMGMYMKIILQSQGRQ